MNSPVNVFVIPQTLTETDPCITASTSHSSEFASNLFNMYDLSGTWMPKSSVSAHSSTQWDTTEVEVQTTLFFAVPFLHNSAEIFCIMQENIFTSIAQHADRLTDWLTDSRAWTLGDFSFRPQAKITSVTACNCQTTDLLNLDYRWACRKKFYIFFFSHIYLLFFFILTCLKVYTFTPQTPGHWES